MTELDHKEQASGILQKGGERIVETREYITKQNKTKPTESTNLSLQQLMKTEPTARERAWNCSSPSVTVTVVELGLLVGLLAVDTGASSDPFALIRPFSSY